MRIVIIGLLVYPKQLKGVAIISKDVLSLLTKLDIRSRVLTACSKRHNAMVISNHTCRFQIPLV